MKTRSTTILAVRKDGKVAIGGDGQVSLGNQIMKHPARKIRKLDNGRVLCGFAGGAADAFALLERFEHKLRDAQGNLRKAAVELAKDWRTDRALRHLDAVMVVVDAGTSLILSGSGDVLEPDDGVVGIGSGGGFAAAAAKALMRHAPALSASEVVEEGLRIAGELCVYTNDCLDIHELDASDEEVRT